MHGFLRLTRTSLAVSLCAAMTACSGGDLAEGTKVPQFTNSPQDGNTTGNDAPNRFKSYSAGIGAFPDLMQLQNDFQCKNNGANPVLGCYVAPSCLADTVKNESYIYLVDITADEIRHQLLFFQHTTQCDGAFYKLAMSAMNMNQLTYGTPVQGANGVSVTPIDGMLASVPFQNTRLSSAWVSGDRARTCFADNDLRWGEDDSLGILYFQVTEPDERPTTIDFSNCLLRLN